MDREAIPQLAEAAKAALPQGEGAPLVRTWREIDPNISNMLASQDAGMGGLLAIVFGVAGLGILNTMLMAVYERTRELGVMTAIGLTPVQVMAMILWEVVLLAVVAGGVGVTLGLGLSLYLVEVGLDLSASTDGLDMLGVAFDPVIRGELRLERFVITTASLIGVAVLAALWPAFRAARLEPVEAMREV